MRKDSRRLKVLAIVREQIDRLGAILTYREIGEAAGISAVAAWKHVQALIAAGKLVKRDDGTITLPGRIDLSNVGTECLRGELARRGVTMDALEQPRLLPHQGRPCAANFCPERVHRGMLFCRRHWFKLPADKRSAIMNAWSARDMDAYGLAVEDARDHLGGFTRVVERVE